MASAQHLRAREAAQRLQGVRRQQHLRARAAPCGLQRMQKSIFAAVLGARRRAHALALWKAWFISGAVTAGALWLWGAPFGSRRDR